MNAILVIYFKFSWVNKALLWVIMLALFPGYLTASTPESYTAIVHDYTEKNYAAVVDTLEDTENKNSTAWYILADAYYNEQKFPQALAAARFARIEAPLKNFSKIFSLTKKIKQQSGQKFSSFKEAYMLFLHAIPEHILELAFVVCWWLFFLSFLITCSSQYCEIFRTVFLGLLIFLGTLLLILNYNNRTSFGIIINQTPLYILPEKNSPARGNVNAGDEMMLKPNNDQSWFKVYQNGLYGWIPADNAVTIEKDLSLSKVRM